MRKPKDEIVRVKTGNVSDQQGKQSLWSCKGFFGMVRARTKSEARAKFKADNGGKLKPGSVITKVGNG